MCATHSRLPFGCDTDCKTFATLVGNVAVDAFSAQKRYSLVRLMGCSASIIASQVALFTSWQLLVSRPPRKLCSPFCRKRKQRCSGICLTSAALRCSWTVILTATFRQRRGRRAATVPLNWKQDARTESTLSLSHRCRHSST